MDAPAQAMERRLEMPLLVAALLTIPAIAIEETSSGATWHAVGVALNTVIWLAFAGEIVLMLRVVPNRRAWLRNHPLELAIVLLTPPILPAALQAARVLRLLRLLRLVERTALVRHMLANEGIRDAAVFALVTVVGGGAAFSAVEKYHHPSAWDGVWWAITTVTTVGYGDEYPRTTAGRLIAIAVMFVGIGFVALLTAAAAERFMRARRAEASELQHLHHRLDEIVGRLDTLHEHRRTPGSGPST